MNSKPEPSSELSRSDADFLAHLTDVAETIEPDPTFTASLEAQLRQNQASNLPQTTHSGTHRMNFVLPGLNRRASLVTCAGLAIAAAFLIPTPTSKQATQWLTTLFGPATSSKANAQTLAQAMATGGVTVTSDTQEFDETTQTFKATGGVVFDYPAAQITAKADEARSTLTSGQLTLFGNVRITQRGETLQGTQATCSFEQQQCMLTRK
jgi:hypothetical protein